MANRTTLVDNNTWNNSHIALVGKAMSSNESAAYRSVRLLCFLIQKVQIDMIHQLSKRDSP